jgi:drug/metabolite transporter (DMT)-like permease
MISTFPVRVWHALHDAVHSRTAHLSPTVRGLLWTGAAGFIFSVLNASLRALTLQHIGPFQAQFLRYFLGLGVLLPIILYKGWAHYKPVAIGGQFTRGAAHTVGLCLWFVALPNIPLADMTAIGSTAPIFIMIGAFLFFKEPMRWERWLATALGFLGVLIVVGPKLTLGQGGGGLYHLVMLAAAPMFAASFLLTKALTRYENTGTILVWQSITVSIFSLPLAWFQWSSPTLGEWLGFGVCGVLGSAGHYCLTRSFKAADISATQSAKFLDLVWSALMGFLLFSDVPSVSTIAGGMLISAATIWVARRESKVPLA